MLEYGWAIIAVAVYGTAEHARQMRVGGSEGSLESSRSSRPVLTR